MDTTNPLVQDMLARRAEALAAYVERAQQVALLKQRLGYLDAALSAVDSPFASHATLDFGALSLTFDLHAAPIIVPEKEGQPAAEVTPRGAVKSKVHTFAKETKAQLGIIQQQAQAAHEELMEWDRKLLSAQKEA